MMRNLIQTLSLFVCLIFACTFNVNSQNLVPNPSFESYSSVFCGIMWASDFNSTMIDWQNPQGSPDIYFLNNPKACYNHMPNSIYTGPIGLKGSQIPRTGEVMAGIWLFTIPGFDQREYIQVPLSPAMTSGKTYIVDYYVSFADSMEKAIDKIGAHLSMLPISGGSDKLLSAVPQVEAGLIIDNSSEWTRIADTIVALDAWAWLTIGNFYNDASTNSTPNPMASNAPGTYGAYYYVDDVSVMELSATTGLEPGFDAFIEVYPTLVEDVLNVQLPDSHARSRLWIRNLQGQEVLHKEIHQGHSKVDVTFLSRGMYVVEIVSGNQRTVKRIVK